VNSRAKVASRTADTKVLVGRGFQLLAKAIEEQAPRLLGLDVDLMRQDADWADMSAEGKSIDRNKPQGPSAHDMEMYGFLAPLKKARGRLALLGRKRKMCIEKGQWGLRGQHVNDGVFT
jgi:hypothetical protein